VSKLVFLLNSINHGGAEQYVYNLSKTHLESHSDNTSVIVSKGGVKKDALDSGRQKIINVPMVRIGVNKLAQLNIKQQLFIYFFPIIKYFYLIRLYRTLKNCDGIISQHGFPTIVASYLSKRLGVKHINVVHHVIPNEYTDIYNHFKVSPDKYIAVSDEVKSFLVKEKDISAHDIEIIYNPIDFNANSELGIVTDKSVTLISHVHEDKADSVEAFCELYRVLGGEYELSICGDFHNSYGLKIYNKYHNFVNFTGALSSDDLRQFISKSSIIVGVGRSALEGAINLKSVIISGHVKGPNGGNYAGLMSSDNLDELSYYNYSGRNARLNSSVSKLKEDILSVEAVNGDHSLLVEMLKSKHHPTIVYEKFIRVINNI
jgi:glycosyltransferase involved in cell wall biosynthesis